MSLPLANMSISLEHQPGLRCATADTLVLVPTFNEAANLARLVSCVLTVSDRLDVLIVDDNSPDGTGVIATALAQLNDRVHVLHRKIERGLGSAYVAGFRWGLGRHYAHFVQLDADFSHDPRSIPALLDQMESCDLVVGSRYCPRGAVTGWPVSRRLLSAAANRYARLLTGVPTRDLTAGFKCWRRAILESIDFDQLRCDGYGFQVEMSFLARQLDARVREVPILFVERAEGCSKMSTRVILQGARRMLSLAGLRLKRQRHPAIRSEKAKRANGTTSRTEKTLVLALGGIGDTVLTFAMARRLRALRPKDHITALAMWPQSAELLEDLGVFDEVRHHHFQQESLWRSLAIVARLRRERFDNSVLCFPANRFEYNVVQWLIHARRRIGHMYLRGSDLTYLRWLLTNRVRQTLGTHNVTENLRLLGPLDSMAPFAAPDVSLGPLSPTYRRFAEQLVTPLGPRLLGIHAGSSSYKNLQAKRWPAERFAELCERAIEEQGLVPLLFGSDQDRGINEAIQRQCPSARIIETPSIRHTAAVMQHCSVFVSNDSALAHMATALDVPTVMVVGPTDDLEVGPFTKTGSVVAAPPTCSPCFRVSRAPLVCKHPERFMCMRGIEVEPVWREVSRKTVRSSDCVPPSTRFATQR